MVSQLIQSKYGSGSAQTARIRKVVTAFFGVEETDFLTDSRSLARVAYIRQVYIYLCWVFTYDKQETIARIFNRDRSIVPYSVKTIRGLCKVNENVRKEIIHLESMVEKTIING